MEEHPWVTHIKAHHEPSEICARYGDMSSFQRSVVKECYDHLYNDCRVRVKDAYRDEVEAIVVYMGLILDNTA